MVDRSLKNIARNSQYSNSPSEYTTKKPKDWKSLNMRVPGGMSILELQNIDKKGYLVEPKIPDNYFDHYGLEDKFTEEEIKAFKEAFLFFDRDGDGTMATEDLALALRAVGLLVTGTEIKELSTKYDPDGSGSIDIKDFLSCIADVSNKADSVEVMQQCFAVFDKENTGVIKTDEFRHVLKAIGDNLSDEEVNSLLKDLDIYGDGHIRMKDLIKVLALKSS